MSTPLFSSFRFQLAFVITAMVWAAMQTAMVYWFGFDVAISAADGSLSAVMLAAACVLIANIFRFYQPSQNRYFYILAPGVILALLVTWAQIYILDRIYPNELSYQSFLFASVPVRFCFAFLVFAWMALLSILVYKQQEQQENEQRKTDAEKLAREAELYNLRQQLQPHFLFNSLNSITALVGSRPEEARKMIHQLSDFLRGTINKDQTPVTLSDELEHLQLYLDIEKVRFGHRLETFITTEKVCEKMMLPPMLLQPIVENAIKFGLYDTTGTVTIRIQSQCVDNELCISVQNPFDPDTTRPKQGTGFGLKGVKRRLYLLFARTDLLQTIADKHIFTTTVKIPQK